MKSNTAFFPTNQALLFIVFLFLLFEAAAFASQNDKNETKGVLAFGVSRVNPRNMAEARKEALANAMNNGVQLYLLGRLGGEVVAEGMERFIGELVPEAVHEVANFNILGEMQTDTTYRLLVKIQVNEPAIERLIKEKGFFKRQERQISVLFMVSKKAPGSGSRSYWWEEPERQGGLLPVEIALHRAFEEMGFTPVSRNFRIPTDENSHELRKPELSDEEAVQWGRLAMSDVVVLGSAFIEDGMASVHLRAVDVTRGPVLAEQAARVALDQALSGEEMFLDGIQRAAKQVSEVIGPDIKESLASFDSVAQRVPLTLHGIRGFDQLRQFTTLLKEGIPGVESVNQTRFKGDSVNFSVSYKNDVGRLIEEIQGRSDLPFSMEVQKTPEGGVSIRIQ